MKIKCNIKIIIFTVVLLIFVSSCYAEYNGQIKSSDEMPIEWNSSECWTVLNLEQNKEILKIQNLNGDGDKNITEDNLTYEVRLYEVNFTAPGADIYYIIPWFGKEYVAIEDNPGKMSSIIFQQKENDKKRLTENQLWDLDNGYSLKFQSSPDGSTAFVTLYRNESELISGVANYANNMTFIGKENIAGIDGAIFFVTHIDSVFGSVNDRTAIIKHTWLLDICNVTEIEEGNAFGSLKVQNISGNSINLSNFEEINLIANDKKYFTDDWYFETFSSGNSWLIRPGKDNTEEESADNNESKSIEDLNISLMDDLDESEANFSTTFKEFTDENLNNSNLETNGKDVYVEEIQNVASLPGFTSIVSIFALISITFMRKRQ